MSTFFTPDSPWRGCAANFPQPINEETERDAQFLEETVYYVNTHDVHPSLPDIVYRSSSGEQDILRHVFRWDLTSYQEVFEHGFTARRADHTPDDVYYSLEHYVHNGGRPVDSERLTTHAFISTTLSSSWHPTVDPGTELLIYRYEIYAPGGIWVAETLGQYYQYPAQDEVCFVAGIAPQYIRSAQLFRLTTPAGSRFTRMERVNNELIINAYINPQSHPYRALPIQNPVDYCMGNGTRVDLNIEYYTSREKRQVSTNTNTTADWYAVNVANTESYIINAAFRSSRENEAYLFMKNEYVLIDYAPGKTNDKVLNGPLLICEGFPSLTGTAFAEHGIDCAFRSTNSDKKEAFIFSGNLCALINYAPRTTDDKIIKGPMTITEMFPFFKGTVFESSVDAAFDAITNDTKYDAYLFKGNQYALINYEGDNPKLVAIRIINEGFPSLKNTIFESGIDAAFASHRKNEAYLFKGDSYALINYAPGTTDDHIIDGVKEILPNWASLRDVLPRKNHGLDVHDHTRPDAERDQDKDEL